jgi:hypothetical protein
MFIIQLILFRKAFAQAYCQHVPSVDTPWNLDAISAKRLSTTLFPTFPGPLMFERTA